MSSSNYLDNYDLALFAIINVAINETIGIDPADMYQTVAKNQDRLHVTKRYAYKKLNRAIVEGINKIGLSVAVCFIPTEFVKAPLDPLYRNHAFILLSTNQGYRAATNNKNDLPFLRSLKRQAGWCNFARYLHDVNPPKLEIFDIMLPTDGEVIGK